MLHIHRDIYGIPPICPVPRKGELGVDLLLLTHIDIGYLQAQYLIHQHRLARHWEIWSPSTPWALVLLHLAHHHVYRAHKGFLHHWAIVLHLDLQRRAARGVGALGLRGESRYRKVSLQGLHPYHVHRCPLIRLRIVRIVEPHAQLHLAALHWQHGLGYFVRIGYWHRLRPRRR